MDMKRKNINILKVVAFIISGLLLIAILDWPKGHNEIYSVIVPAFCGYVAYIGYNKKIAWVLWWFGFLAVLYNPVFPVQLDGELWTAIDITTGVFLLVLACRNKLPTLNNADDAPPTQ